jgi:hypothetical protein
MTCDHKKFDYILARSRTRESSTLTIATVASSASLVLIALYIQAEVEDSEGKLEKYKGLIQGMGLLFPIIGILYREVTARTHKKDEDFLKEQALSWNDPLANTHDTRRTIILRILLLTPIPAWFFVMANTTSVISHASIVIIGLYLWGMFVWEG